MKKFLVTAIVGFGIATSASSWGDREQGALAGIVGTIIWQKINENQTQPVTQPSPPIIYREQQTPIYRPHRIPQRNTCYVWREIQHPDGTIVREIQCHGVQ